METTVIRHGPRGIHYSYSRRIEFEAEPRALPIGISDADSRCPECGCTMMYRGIAQLRNGLMVHHFECVHSPREVHGISIHISE